jgi:hypothetical protein
VSSKIAPVDWVEKKVIELASHMNKKGERKLLANDEDDSPTANVAVSESSNSNLAVAKELDVFDQICCGQDDPFVTVGLELHLNGEANACSTTNPSVINLSQGEHALALMKKHRTNLLLFLLT